MIIKKHNYPENKYIIEKHQCNKCKCKLKKKSKFQLFKDFLFKLFCFQ